LGQAPPTNFSQTMDPITHALSGALAARSLAASRQITTGAIPLWQITLVVTLAAVFPDIDALLGYVSDIATLTDRRGVTHSLVMMPLWALLLGWIWSRLFKRPHQFWHFSGFAAVGIVLHIVFDLINAFGVMLLAPFSWHRFDWGTTFIIDLGLMALLLTGLVLTLTFKRLRWIGMASCVVVAGYLGIQLWAKQAALALAHNHAASIQRGNEPLAVDVLPRPLSPFHWTLVVSDKQSRQYAHVHLLRQQPLAVAADAGMFSQIRAAFAPVADANWQIASIRGQSTDDTNIVNAAQIEQLWSDPAFGFFREFASLPILMSTAVFEDRRCANFEDLRFVSPGRESHPFRYGICQYSTSGKKPLVYVIEETGETPINRTTRLLF
jgi:inner membrane protein